MSAYDKVCARLVDRTSGTGRNGTWPCPAHDDRNPSLSVSRGDCKVLVHCHAGCTTDAILAALNLEPRDLFDEPRTNGQRRILRTHNYIDEEGTLLYQTVRFEGTGDDRFRQRRPDGTGGWIWNLKDVRRVVYNLPSVLEAIEAGKPILLAEGEHDADALIRAGAVATTNPLGARNWRPEYTQTLAEADIALVIDRDDTGRKRAVTLMAELEAAGCTIVAVYEPVEGKDAAEVLGMGYDLDTGFQAVTIDPPADDDEDDDHATLPDGHRATDVGNAARLLEHAGDRLRYLHVWGKWLVWRGGRWVIDDNDAIVTEIAKRVSRALFKLLPKAKDKDERERIWNWAIRSESSGAIAAMVRLARGAPGVLVEHEQLDANPYILNVRNGTIDLHTGKLRAADPADLCTMQCPVAFDTDATAPLWETCIDRWQPDRTMQDYLQARAGAGATGKPTETVDVDYGLGGNGKSKFWGAIQHVLGPYATVPHKSLLVAQRHEQHATVVADMFRKRLAVASETKAADVLDDEQVKNLTGGDRLKGRRMREDPWEFWPTHTLVMFSNHRPQVQGRDEGIWRRLRLVPWEVTIPEDERDDDLATKLQAEASGILRWIVDGARQFTANGLTPPDAVRVATDAYRASEDVIGRFIADVLQVGDGWVFSSEIKAELDAWCTDHGIDPPRFNEVTEVLRSLGCRDGGRRKIRGQRSTIWHGVRVAEIKENAL